MQAGKPGGSTFTSRDVVTFLLAVEFTFVFHPLASLLNEAISGNPREGLTMSRWFLLTIFFAKVYVALCELLRMPPWAQCTLLLASLLFCYGSLITFCVDPEDTYSPLTLFAKIFDYGLSDEPFGTYPYHRDGRVCVPIVSFESSRLTCVGVYNIFLFALVFHYGPLLVRVTNDHVKALKRSFTSALQRTMPPLAAFAVRFAREVKLAVGLLLFFGASYITIFWVEGGKCQGIEGGIFHPSLYRQRPPWAPPYAVVEPAPLTLAPPEWLVTVDIPSQDIRYSQGTACALGNLIVYTAVLWLVGLSLACCTCVHFKLTGSTTLGAYCVQIFLAVVPTATWLSTPNAVAEAFAAGMPFQGLDIMVFALVVVMGVAGPLFQWGLILPQIYALMWVGRQGVELWEESCAPCVEEMSDRVSDWYEAHVAACWRRRFGERTPLLEAGRGGKKGGEEQGSLPPV